jgi:hypothetical protein
MPGILARAALAASLSGVLLLPHHQRLPVDLEPDPGFAVPDSVLVELTWVTALARGQDGSLFLTDQRFPALFHLAPDGRLLRILGRRGGGPGEFTSIARMGVVGDSVWALDMGWRRLTLFPVAGQGVATIPLQELAGRGCTGELSSGRLCVPLGFADRNTMYLGEHVIAVPGRVTPNDHGMLFRARRADFAVVDTVFEYPLRRAPMTFRFRDAAAQLNQPFTDDPLAVHASNGRYVALVERLAATAPGRTEFSVTLADGQGRELYHAAIPYRPAPLEGRTVDSAIARILDVGAEQRIPSPLTRDSLLAKLYRPRFHPPVRQAVVGQDGTVWVQVVEAGQAPGRAEWRGLGPGGDELARVTTPPTFRLLEATLTQLWGVEGEWGDVPRVVRYQVRAERASN